MARYSLGRISGIDVTIEYNTNNGRVSQLWVDNTTADPIRAVVDLANGGSAGKVFQPGNTFVNFPNNIVTISFDADGEANFGGITGYHIGG